MQTTTVRQWIDVQFHLLPFFVEVRLSFDSLEHRSLPRCPRLRQYPAKGYCVKEFFCEGGA